MLYLLNKNTQSTRDYISGFSVKMKAVEDGFLFSIHRGAQHNFRKLTKLTMELKRCFVSLHCQTSKFRKKIAGYNHHMCRSSSSLNNIVMTSGVKMRFRIWYI